MKLARVFSRACSGVDAPLITVEVHLGGGLPRMPVVGMPEAAVREARDRVRAALQNSGFDVPQRLITVALAPAELPKDGGGYDLPIALGVLAASGQVQGERLKQVEFLGELSLGGELRPVRGVLPAALRAAADGRMLVVPRGNSPEAGLLRDGQCLAAESLLDVAAWLNGDEARLKPIAPATSSGEATPPDLADVIGQAQAVRALEIAAAGAHNLLMVGPPGTGKTMLASRLVGILPPMSETEALEAAAIASISHLDIDVRRWRMRPFRAPHHTASGIALVGGGAGIRPGEVSLAHHGVLFLDELTEFSRQVLEVLREPLESGVIHLSRAARQASFPARFQLVCAMNPCPCGQAGDPCGDCRCSGDQIARYRARVSGPFLDRIDLRVEVPRPTESLLEAGAGGKHTSVEVRARVDAARQRQHERQGCVNAHLDPRGVMTYCLPQTPGRELLEKATRKLRLSPRAAHRVLKVARSIADLEGQATPGIDAVAEAIALRRPSSLRRAA